MALSVEVHFPQLSIPLGVFAGHVVHRLCRVGLHDSGLGPELQQRHEAQSLERIGGGYEERLATRGGERVTELGTPQRRGPRAAIAEGFALMWENLIDPFLYYWI
jgi:hypothetical protein